MEPRFHVFVLSLSEQKKKALWLKGFELSLDRKSRQFSVKINRAVSSCTIMFILYYVRCIIISFICVCVHFYLWKFSVSY